MCYCCEWCGGGCCISSLCGIYKLRTAVVHLLWCISLNNSRQGQKYVLRMRIVAQFWNKQVSSTWSCRMCQSRALLHVNQDCHVLYGECSLSWSKLCLPWVTFVFPNPQVWLHEVVTGFTCSGRSLNQGDEAWGGGAGLLCCIPAHLSQSCSAVLWYVLARLAKLSSSLLCLPDMPYFLCQCKKGTEIQHGNQI